MVLKTLKIFLIILSFLFLFTNFYPKKVFAAVTVTGYREDPTDWQFKATYYDANNTVRAGPVYMYMRSPGVGDYFADWKLTLTPLSGDYVRWHTACVDPTTPVYIGGVAEFDAGCHYGVVNAIYAGCYRLSSSRDYGSIGANSQCPYADNTDSYCTAAGTTAYPTLCGNSYCGGANGCTYYNKTCSETSCSHPSTQYSTKCGGNNITNTYMCSAWSATCSPPAPTVTATAVCNGENPNINVNYVPNSGTPGNRSYDLRWKKSTDSWGGSGEHDVCSPPTSGTGIDYTITSGALESNTTYNVQVREHTDSGYNGPTNFGSDTVTTPNCGSTISGNVYNDNDNSGSKNTGDTNHSGVTVTLSNGATDTTDTNGNYSFAGIAAGTYITSLPASVTGYYIPIRTSSSLTVPPNQTYNFRLVPLSTININVYNDYNGNATYEPALGETLASGQTVTVTGGGAQTYTADGTTKTISNLNPGGSTITVGALASGWTFTTTNSVPVSYPPPVIQTVNIGIKPPAPTCTSLTANPTSVSPGGTSILTCNSPSSPAGGSIVYTYYDDSTIAGDSVTNNNTNTSTFRAPNPYWNQTVAYPSVSVCNPGGAGAACNNYQAAITIIPRFSISGNVFVDQNKDGLKNGSDTNYTDGSSTIQIHTGSCGGPLIQSVNTANGTYTTGSNLVGNTYYVCYTSLPGGYKMTNPVNGPPASFSVRVGNLSTGGACSVGGSSSAACDANGNITNLNYGISDSIPWIQTTGGDTYFANGVSNPIPDNNPSCGPYMSLQGNGGTPGIVYIGNGSANLGFGQASANPYNWIVGGLTFPHVFTPKGSELKSSYNTMYKTAIRSGIPPTPLGNSQCGAGGIGNCVLAANLSNGVYIANGNLTLTGASYTFAPSRDIVILINGDLNINTEIHVPTNSTAIFTASGNINVANSVGEAVVTSTRSNIEGYYSADQNFYVKSLDANGGGANCSTLTPDRRLNIGGSVVANAKLLGGSFVNQRDLCTGNLQCPAATVIERPDFVLNSPEFLKSARRVWREIAP